MSGWLPIFDNIHYQGYLGTSAARRGDREKAMRISEELAKPERPISFELSFVLAGLHRLAPRRKGAGRRPSQGRFQSGIGIRR